VLRHSSALTSVLQALPLIFK